jgi:N-acetylgalactosamine-6-sulfatase
VIGEDPKEMAVMLNRSNGTPVVGASLAAVALALLAGGAQAAEGRPPNIILMLADDLGWGDLGCYGHREMKTPNLDRLAAEGSLYTQFYMAAAVCSPSRTALMTGQFPAKQKILYPISADKAVNRRSGTPDYLDPKILTLTRQLKKAGYITGHFGKWHLGGPAGSPAPDAYGVDEYKVDLAGMPPEHRLFPQGAGPRRIIEANKRIADEAIRFLEAHREQPFYLNLWTPTPHVPLYPTDEQMKPYADLKPSPQIPYPGAKQVYYAAVTEMDRQFGRVLDRLAALGLAGNTIVLFSSDNGPENIHQREAGISGVGSPGPFRGHKASIYEGGIRLPFIVRWPGHVPARRVEDNAVLAGVDLFPTLCRLAGVEVSGPLKQELDGEDVGGILLGATRPRTRPLFWENRFWYYEGSGTSIINKSPQLAIRQGPWKLLMNPDGSRVELYNLPQDPSEVDNKAVANPRIIEELSKKLLAWKKSMPAGVKTIPADAGDYKYPWPGRGGK